MCLAPAAFPAASVDDIEAEYELAHYDRAITLAKETLALSQLTLDEEVRTRELMAFSYVALGFNDEAQKEFRTILKVKPEFDLVPAFTSPKIVSVFGPVKERAEREKQVQARPFDYRRAAMRSALFPGLGQVYKGEKKKGYVIAGSEVVLLSATLYSHLKYRATHGQYLKSVEPAEIEKNYGAYNDWYRARLAFAGAAAAVWVYSHLDAALTTAPVKEERVGYFSIGILPESDRVSVALQISIQ